MSDKNSSLNSEDSSTNRILSEGIESERIATGGLDSGNLRKEAARLYPDIIDKHARVMSAIKTELATGLEKIESKSYLSESGKEEEREKIRAELIGRIEELEGEHLSWIETEMRRLSSQIDKALYEGDEDVGFANALENAVSELVSVEAYTDLSRYQKANMRLNHANYKLLGEIASSFRRQEMGDVIRRRPFDAINMYKEAVTKNRNEIIQYFEENFGLLSTDSNASKEFVRLQDERISKFESKAGDHIIRQRLLTRYFEDYKTGRRLARRAGI